MNDRFLKACRREPVDRTPVWFMRQAGRYMPEYREIRSRHSLLDICRSPELATIVTLQPVRRIDVDAGAGPPQETAAQTRARDGDQVRPAARGPASCVDLRQRDLDETLAAVGDLLRRETAARDPAAVPEQILGRGPVCGSRTGDGLVERAPGGDVRRVHRGGRHVLL